MNEYIVLPALILPPLNVERPGRSNWMRPKIENSGKFSQLAAKKGIFSFLKSRLIPRMNRSIASPASDLPHIQVRKSGRSIWPPSKIAKFSKNLPSRNLYLDNEKNLEHFEIFMKSSAVGINKIAELYRDDIHLEKNRQRLAGSRKPV